MNEPELQSRPSPDGMPDEPAPAQKSSFPRRLTAYSLCLAFIMVTVGILAVMAGVLLEISLRDGPSLPAPPERSDELPDFGPIPTHALTSTVRIKVNRADQDTMSDIIEHAVERNGGYAVLRLDDQTTYAGPRMVALALHRHAQEHGDAMWPDLPAYQQLADSLAEAQGPPDVQFTVTVSQAGYERPAALYVTIGGSVLTVFAIMIIAVTLICIMTSESLSRVGREDE